MKQSKLMEWAGLVGMLSAVLLALGTILHPPVENLETVVIQNWTWTHLLMGKSLLFGLSLGH